MILDEAKALLEKRGFAVRMAAYDLVAERGQLWIEVAASIEDGTVYLEQACIDDSWLAGERDIASEAELDALLAECEQVAREGLEATLAEAFPKGVIS